MTKAEVCMQDYGGKQKKWQNLRIMQLESLLNALKNS